MQSASIAHHTSTSDPIYLPLHAHDCALITMPPKSHKQCQIEEAAKMFGKSDVESQANDELQEETSASDKHAQSIEQKFADMTQSPKIHHDAFEQIFKDAINAYEAHFGSTEANTTDPPMTQTPRSLHP
jgi:hypothetical protein